MDLTACPSNRIRYFPCVVLGGHSDRISLAEHVEGTTEAELGQEAEPLGCINASRKNGHQGVIKHDVVFSYFNNNTTRNRTNRCRIMSILRVSIHRECIGCMHQALIKLVLIYPLESMLFFCDFQIVNY
jgi:hypothetical protein